MNPLAALLASLTGAAPAGRANGNANLSEAGVFAQLLDASAGDAQTLSPGLNALVPAELAALPHFPGETAESALFEDATALLPGAQQAHSGLLPDVAGETEGVPGDAALPADRLPVAADAPEGAPILESGEAGDSPLTDDGTGATVAEPQPDGEIPGALADGTPESEHPADPAPELPGIAPADDETIAAPAQREVRTGLDRAFERAGDGPGLRGLQNAASQGSLPPGQQPPSPAPEALSAAAPKSSSATSGGAGAPATQPEIDAVNARVPQRPDGQSAAPRNGENPDRQLQDRPTVLPSRDEAAVNPAERPTRSQRATAMTSLLRSGAGLAAGMAAADAASTGDLQPAGVTALDAAAASIGQRGPAPAAPPLPQPAPVPAHSLAVHIAQQFQTGMKRFEIRLDPPELGRVEVRLDVTRDGHVTTHLTVDRPETLDLLQRDARTLERALQDAGLDTSEGGLKFSLKDHGQADDGLDGEQRSQTRGHQSENGDAAEEEGQPVVWTRPYATPGGVDIRI